MSVGETAQVGAGHQGAVVVHELADHADRRQSGQPDEFDGGLGVTGPLPDSAVDGAQRQDVAGPDQVRALRRGIGQHADGPRPVRGGDAGADAGRRVDGHGVRRPQAVLVVRHHQRQLEPVQDLRRGGRADVAAGVADEQGHQLGGREARGEGQVALVLAVLVVDDHHGSPDGDLGDGALDGVQAGDGVHGRCPLGSARRALRGQRQAHAPVSEDVRLPRASSHPDFHRRSWSSTRSTAPPRGVTGRGLSPPARNFTDPRARVFSRPSA